MSNDINIDSICQKIQDRCLLNNNEVKYMDSNGKIWAYEDKPTHIVTGKQIGRAHV